MDVAYDFIPEDEISIRTVALGAYGPCVLIEGDTSTGQFTVTVAGVPADEGVIRETLEVYGALLSGANIRIEEVV